jgi:hypothetical protein
VKVTRHFILPMQEPSTASDASRVQRMWKPKYLSEIEVDFRIFNAREVCLAEVTGDEEILSSLSSNFTDVIEIGGSGPLIASKHKAITMAFSSLGIGMRPYSTEDELVNGLKKAIVEWQSSPRDLKALASNIIERRTRGS